MHAAVIAATKIVIGTLPPDVAMAIDVVASMMVSSALLSFMVMPR